jgi:hypothetical protein
MRTIGARQKKRLNNGLMIFSLGTMIVGVFLLLAAFPFKRGKGPYRFY